MKIKLSTIIRLCALILVILFFVPTTIVSCNSYMTSYEVEVSPFGLATGTLNADSEDAEEYTEEIEAQPVLFVMLGLSVVLLILGSKFPILGAIVTLANTVMLYLMYNGIVDYIVEEYDGMGVHVSKTGAFTGYVALTVVVIVLLIMKQFRIFDRLYQLKKPANPEVSTDPSETDRGESNICLNCGETVEAGSTFCGNCGHRITRG